MYNISPIDTTETPNSDDMATGNGGAMIPGNAESDMPRNPQLSSEIGDCFGEKSETDFVLTLGAVQSYENILANVCLLKILDKADPLPVPHLAGGS